MMESRDKKRIIGIIIMLLVCCVAMIALVNSPLPMEIKLGLAPVVLFAIVFGSMFVIP